MLLFFDPLALLQSAPQSSSHPFNAENVQAVSLKREILRTFSLIHQNIFTHILYFEFERGLVKSLGAKKTEASSSCRLTSYVICLPLRTSANIFQRASKIAFALTDNKCFGATQFIIFTLINFFVLTLKKGSIICFFLLFPLSIDTFLLHPLLLIWRSAEEKVATCAKVSNCKFALTAKLWVQYSPIYSAYTLIVQEEVQGY